MKEDTDREAYALESVLGWTEDGSVMVVSETLQTGGGDYRVSAYQWRAGKPVQLFWTSWDPTNRFTPKAGAVVNRAPARTTKEFAAYRSKGTKVKGVKFNEDFLTFSSKIAGRGAKNFAVNWDCQAIETPPSRSPGKWTPPEGC